MILGSQQIGGRVVPECARPTSDLITLEDGGWAVGDAGQESCGRALSDSRRIGYATAGLLNQGG